MATPQFNYTGTYDLQIIDDIKGYVRLLTSGTLTFNQDIFIDAYLLGGGGDGADGTTYNAGTQIERQFGGGGGGSGYATNAYNIFANNGASYNIDVGDKGKSTTAFNVTVYGGKSASSANTNGGDGGDYGGASDGRLLVDGYWTTINPGRNGTSQAGWPDTMYAFNRDKPPFSTMPMPYGGSGTKTGTRDRAANSGAGGHGSYYGSSAPGGRGGYGGSGIVIIRWGFTENAFLTNLNPTAGFVNEKIDNKFLWNLISIPIQLEQQSGTFQWRVRNSSDINTINIGTDQFVIVPANTLPQGEFEWRVSAANASGIIVPFTDWFLLTTIDAKPNKPTGLYPHSGVRDGTRPIQFSWIHNSPLSTPQSAFELQVTYDGGATWLDLSNMVASAITQFTAAADTILPTDPTGRIGWRVRTYNSDDVSSDWSDSAFFIVHPAPQAPNWISVETARSRPLGRWISLGQVGFQLQVLSGETVLFDSGEIFGTQTEYRMPQYLPNGIYIFKVRIKNVRGLLSEWADFPVSINARRTLQINLTGDQTKNGVQLIFDADVR